MTEKHDSIALVTGATDGIGKETARQLAQAGVSVIIGARTLSKGQSVADELGKDGSKVEVVQLDVCDDASVHAAARTIEQRHGRLDILVNNAGIALDHGRPLSAIPMADLVATYETNVFGAFRVIQAVLPLIRRSARGRIVNVSSSLASFHTMTDASGPYYHFRLPAYASSKAALNALTLQLAYELRDTGIKVNAVDPGLTATRNVSAPGAQPVELGAQASVRYALIGDDGPTGRFFDRNGEFNW